MGSSGGGFLTAFSVEENVLASFHLRLGRKCQLKISARRRGFEKSFCTAPALTTGADSTLCTSVVCSSSSQSAYRSRYCLFVEAVHGSYQRLLEGLVEGLRVLVGCCCGY